jgi:ABC-2 type transport system ATP-binding protein
MDAVEVRDLVVDRGRRRVLHDVSFTVRAGRVTGLLGPSGSG